MLKLVEDEVHSIEEFMAKYRVRRPLVSLMAVYILSNALADGSYRGVASNQGWGTSHRRTF